jgi:hypothetical protein
MKETARTSQDVLGALREKIRKEQGKVLPCLIQSSITTLDGPSEADFLGYLVQTEQGFRLFMLDSENYDADGGRVAIDTRHTILEIESRDPQKPIRIQINHLSQYIGEWQRSDSYGYDDLGHGSYTFIRVIALDPNGIFTDLPRETLMARLNNPGFHGVDLIHAHAQQMFAKSLQNRPCRE